MKYKWLVKEYGRVASAESVAKELKRIYLVNGRLGTLDMVASANFPGSPLHPFFDRISFFHTPPYELERTALRILCALVDEKGRDAFIRGEYGYKPAHYNKKIAAIIKAMLELEDDV